MLRHHKNVSLDRRSNLLIRNLVPLSSHRAHTRISASRRNFAFVDFFPWFTWLNSNIFLVNGLEAETNFSSAAICNPNKRQFSLLFTNLFSRPFSQYSSELIKNYSDSGECRKYHSRFALVYFLNLWRWNQLKVALKLRYQSDPWHVSSTCPIHLTHNTSFNVLTKRARNANWEPKRSGEIKFHPHNTNNCSSYLFYSVSKHFRLPVALTRDTFLAIFHFSAAFLLGFQGFRHLWLVWNIFWRDPRPEN